MAKYVIERVKYGYKNNILSENICIADIIPEGDEILTLPEYYEGEPITHLGFYSVFEPAHEVWADYHHPAKGSDYVEDKYIYGYRTFDLPGVKKVIIPKTIAQINSFAFDRCPGIEVEIDPENETYCVREREILYKKRDYVIVRLK